MSLFYILRVPESQN